MRLSLNSTGGKVLASTVVLGAAATIAGLGTFGSFTSTTSASTQADSGTVTIALGATGGSTNRLNINATGLVPGDTVQRSVTLSNTGSQALASLALTTTATTSSLLDTDATNGLQMAVDKCSTGWVEAGSSPAFTYSCTGTVTSVVAQRAVIGSNLPLGSLGALASGGSDSLRVTLTFPSAAGDTFQGKTSTISFSFAGTQRVATAH
ncbi:TasA family protein [Oryzihumus sp.]